MLFEEIMIDEVLLEQRVAILERVVADLQLRLTAAPDASNWLDKVTGSISDEPASLRPSRTGGPSVWPASLRTSPATSGEIPARH